MMDATTGSMDPPDPGEALRARLPQALKALSPIVFSTVRRSGLANGEPIAQVVAEILQETACQALKLADRYDPARPLRNWLFVIHQKVLLRYRSQLRKSRGRFVDIGAEEAMDLRLRQLGEKANRSNPEEALAAKQEVDQVLESMPEHKARVLRLYYLELAEDDEALAAALSTTLGNVRVLRHRSLKEAQVAKKRNGR